MDSDLISRSALLEKFCTNSITNKITFSDGKSINETVEAAPAVDAVEVVRCEKCIFKQAFDGFGDLLCGMLKVPMKNNDFCSYGEREADVDA